jgi:hypothetical protein
MTAARIPLSPRVERYVLRHYPDRFTEIVDLLETVELPLIHGEPEGRERVQAAMLAAAHGDVDRLLDAAVLAQEDWRDVLMAVPRFAHEGWGAHVDQLLGPKTMSPEA